MKVNYLFKFMVAAFFLFAATIVKAADITVTGEDRAALTAALDQAVNGDVIILTKSIAIGDDQFTVTKGVTVRGATDGIEIKPAADYTSRVLQIQPGDDDGVKLIFENITFRDANNQGNATGGEKDGGLGRIANGVIEFNNCKFINNFSADRGGVFDMYGGNATFTNCEFTGNKTSGRGGAFFVRGTAVLNIRGSKVLDNNSTGRGGAFFLEGNGTAQIYNSLIKGNSTGTRTWNEADAKFSYTGEGGAVFTTSGTPTLYVESSSVVENESNGDHGGILFAMGTPVVTFVNTTLANNIMWKDSNSMFFLNDNGTFTFVNSTIAGNSAGSYNGQSFGPNAGNSTGMNIRNALTRVKFINSIFVGNTSNNGAAVDINYRNEIKDNVADVLEIQNSIVGFISNLSAGQLLSIPGYATSLINTYANSPEWKENDKSGINWSSGLKTLENGQAYYPVIGTSSAIGLGDPALLSAYITPLVDQIGTAREGTKITSGAIEYVKGDSPLPLDGVNRIWGGTAENPCAYDPFTHTVSYSGGWSSNVGWQFGSVEPLDQTAEDWSDYGKVVIKFAAPLPTGIALHIQYLDADGNLTTAKKEDGGELDAFVNSGSTEVSLALDKTLRNKVKSVYFSIQNDCQDCTTGTIVLKDAYLLEEGYVLPYSINELNFFDGATYNEDTHTATYNNGWSRLGWNWEADGGISATGNNQVWIKFDASALPATNEGEHRAKLQFDLEYMDGSKETSGGGGFNGGNEYRASATEAFWTLSHPEKKIKLITLKSETTGNVVLTDAYFYNKPVDPVDVIVTNVRWTPVNPAPGDSVTFYATVKNISEFATPVNEKVGVAFSVTGATDPVSWSDGYFGPLAAGDSIELSSRGAGSTGALWVVKGTLPAYTVRAVVNDSKNIIETNYDNNAVEAKMTIDAKADVRITSIRLDEDPEDVKGGDKLVFTATVNNSQGAVDTPAGVITGVAFSVNGTVVSWSDDYTASIPAKSIALVRLTANGGPNNGDGSWTIPSAGGEFTISAHVNDQKRYDESDFTNNIYTMAEITISAKNAINSVATEGSVYVVNGQIRLKGYSGNAQVTVYNLIGQPVATSTHAVLTTGTYIVKVQDNGKPITHKVVVK